MSKNKGNTVDPQALIEKYGAVSKEVASLMAKGIKNKTKSGFSSYSNRN